MANNRFIFTQGNLEEQKPGSWWRALHGRVFIRCPVCRTTSHLGSGEDGHAINDGGEVHPSLICDIPKGCTFHQSVTLEGWPNV